jgi:L,D-peptidoglycan transpeptidase YkuD (ErfK/YbiS/YcfS/YnhG family)
LKTVLALAVLLVCVFCSSTCQIPPVPLEVEKVKGQENNLWRAGAPIYAADEYARYLEALRLAKEKLIQQNARLGWFRDYKEVRADYIVILAQGDALLRSVQAEKRSQSEDFSLRLSRLEERAGKIKALTQLMNEHAPVRECLARADVVCREARLLIGNEKYSGLGPKLDLMDGHIRQAEEALSSILVRYADEGQVARWRKLAEDAVSESRRRGTTVVLVNKLARTLTLFKRGKAVAVHEIGLGKCGLSDKLYAGDEATPEGRYKIVKKNAQSRYHKALLIDYPNEQDRVTVRPGQEAGIDPARAGIGGLIEIHGGGKDSLTNGCVGVENSVMDRIFPEVAVGSVVVIVGSLEGVAKLLAGLRISD